MSTTALGSQHPISTLALVRLRVRGAWFSLRRLFRRELPAPGELDDSPGATEHDSVD